MSKQTSVQAKSTSSRGLTRSSPSLLERRRTLGPHVCVQREAEGPAVHPAAPSLVRGVVDSPGRPLDAATRSDMEPRFGYDFSQVRVHSDDHAAESARAVNANAYTAGNHVVFGAGTYAPRTSDGQHLLAHELTHVVQQASGPVPGTPIGGGLSVSDPSDTFEQTARATAPAAASGPNLQTDRGAESHEPLNSPRPHTYRDHLQRSDADSPLQVAAAQGSASAAQSSAGAAQLSAFTGLGSAIVGGFTGLVGAFAAVRAANFAERSAQAAEDPPTAEPTTGGITVTDADIPEIKALDTKAIDAADKDPDSMTVTTGTDETQKSQDVAKTTGSDTETTEGKGKNAKKITAKNETTTTDKAGTTTTRKSTSKVFKPPADKPDVLKTYKVLNINQGPSDSADFYVSIRSNTDDIKDGGTEPPNSTGYLGGSSESNASVNFKARPGAHNPDGSATVKLLIGGTNTPPRKTLQGSSFFGGQGPEVNKNYGVQRFGGSITFDANPDGKSADPKVEAKKRPPIVDPRLRDAGKVGDGEKDALVTISLPEKYHPTVKKYEKGS
ncbi:MAG: DUF4157 domain-containing protein [Isosphaerales bacterium]